MALGGLRFGALTCAVISFSPPGVKDAHWTEPGGRAGQAALCAGLQPVAGDRLPEQQEIPLLAHEELAEPAARI